jgi:phosphonate transport system substrate-binding protein
MADLRLTYYPDITQGQSAADVHAEVEVFAGALGAALSKRAGQKLTIEVPPVLSVAAQYDDMVGGGSAIALMKPVAYVFAHKLNSNIIAACVALRPIDEKVGVSYYGQIYARSDLNFSSIQDIKQAEPETLTIAFGNRFSTSNFLMPAHALWKAGVHPFLHFKSVVFAGGHDHAAELTYKGGAQLGVGHDGAITILKRTRPDADQKLKQIHRVDIYSDPVVVRTDLLPHGVTLLDVQKACEEISSLDEVKKALDIFWGWVRGLRATQHAPYQPIADAVMDLGLREQDMLG